MEIVINNIGFEQDEIYCIESVKSPLGFIEQAAVDISFDMVKNGSKLTGNHVIHFDKYRKMTHDDLVEHIKQKFL